MIAENEIVYLAGPMTGVPDFNYPAFNRVASKLRVMGCTVLNPAETFGGNQSLPYTTYIRKNILDMTTVHHLAVLDNSLSSAGARLEMAMAVALGLPVWHVHEPDEKYASIELVPYSQYTGDAHDSLKKLFMIL